MLCAPPSPRKGHAPPPAKELSGAQTRRPRKLLGLEGEGEEERKRPARKWRGGAKRGKKKLSLFLSRRPGLSYLFCWYRRREHHPPEEQSLLSTCENGLKGEKERRVLSGKKRTPHKRRREIKKVKVVDPFLLSLSPSFPPLPPRRTPFRGSEAEWINISLIVLRTGRERGILSPPALPASPSNY